MRQEIVNLLNSSKNEFSKFATGKWYVVDSKLKGSYSHHDPINFITKSIKSSIGHYSDAQILVTGNIDVTRTIALMLFLILLFHKKGKTTNQCNYTSII